MTNPNVQSSLVPCLADFMRLIGIESMVGHSAVLNMSLSYVPYCATV